MKEYYIVIDNEKQGPFSLEELREKDIFASTLIWTEEMEDWNEAKSFEELKDILKKSIPPIPKQANLEKNKSQIKTKTKVLVAKEIKINFKLIRYALLIGIISLPIFFAYNKGFTHIKMEIKWRKSEGIKDKSMKQFQRIPKFKNKTGGQIESIYLEDRLELEAESERIRSEDLIKREIESKILYRKKKHKITFEEKLRLPLKHPLVDNANQPLDYHVVKRKYIAKDAFWLALKTVPIAWLLIILGRYIIKGVRWIDDTSKEE